MSCCYILFSKKLGRFYFGACHDDLDLRIEKHNNHAYGKHRYTATADDWELYTKIDTHDFVHAVRIERKIKSMKSSKYIRNLTKYPDLVQKIIAETAPGT